MEWRRRGCLPRSSEDPPVRVRSSACSSSRSASQTDSEEPARNNGVQICPRLSRHRGSRSGCPDPGGLHELRRGRSGLGDADRLRPVSWITSSPIAPGGVQNPESGQTACMLRIRLLGSVDAVDGGGELALGGSKPRALLAVLALAAPRACSSEQIIDSLWGDDPPPSARNAVQVYVTALRKALRPHEVEIVRVGDGYALRGSVAADVPEFEQLVSEGRASLRSGDAGRSAARLMAALDLWRGHPLEGLEAPSFSNSVRAMLEATRSAALVDLAEAQLRLGDTSAAARTAQTLLADHPYDERGWIASPPRTTGAVSRISRWTHAVGLELCCSTSWGSIPLRPSSRWRPRS